MALYRLPGIVLRTHPFQDTHLIVSLLSPTKGKIRAIAKGCRRLQSSLGRIVQPMVYASFQLAEGKSLDSITQGVVKCAFQKTRGDLERVTHGLYALELIERLVEEPEPQSNLFFLLLKTLEGLEAGEEASGVLRIFEAHLIRILGYTPELDQCVKCGKNNLLVRFSIRLGGVLCEACTDADKQALEMSHDACLTLKQSFQGIIGRAPQASREALQEVSNLFQAFIEDKCGKKLHGRRLLEQIERLSLSK